LGEHKRRGEDRKKWISRSRKISWERKQWIVAQEKEGK
jgi:hypothetical protein